MESMNGLLGSSETAEEAAGSLERSSVKGDQVMKRAAYSSSNERHAEGGSLLLRIGKAARPSSDINDNATVRMEMVADSSSYTEEPTSNERRSHEEGGRLVLSIDAHSCSWGGRISTSHWTNMHN